MSGGALFANASVIMQGDAHLLTRKRIREMAAAETREELLKVLAECGYQTDLPDDTAIIDAERAQTLKTLTELGDDPALVTAFTALDNATEDNYVAAFQTIADSVQKIKTPSIRDYFTTLADLTNVRLFYKGSKTFVPGGKLTPSELAIFPDMTPDEIEKEIDRRLDALATVDKDDIFTPNPLFWWYLQKQKEFKVVRTILMCKRFNYHPALIRTTLGELYEQFN